MDNHRQQHVEMDTQAGQLLGPPIAWWRHHLENFIEDCRQDIRKAEWGLSQEEADESTKAKLQERIEGAKMQALKLRELLSWADDWQERCKKGGET